FLTCGPENAVAARKVDPNILVCHNRRSLVPTDQFLEEATTNGAAFVQFGWHRPYTQALIAEIDSRGIKTTYACATDLLSTQKLLADGIRFPLVDHIEDVALHW